jgi:hypothetical protein
MYIDIQPGQLGFDHSLQVRRSLTGVPRELRDGDTVIAGDRIRVVVQTSVDAYLYLAFCSQRGLTLYPSQGGVRTQAGVLASVPLNTDLVVDDEPGTEVLYVVASTVDISLADPRLAAALATKRPSNAAQDCGPTLDASLRSPPSVPRPAALQAAQRQLAPTPKVIRGQPVAKRPMPASVESLSPSSFHTAEPPTSPSFAPSPPPDPDFVRHPGNIVWYRGHDTRGPGSIPHVSEPCWSLPRTAPVSPWCAMSSTTLPLHSSRHDSRGTRCPRRCPPT